jgi:DNA-binding CsgD family transcriptional regulator
MLDLVERSALAAAARAPHLARAARAPAARFSLETLAPALLDQIDCGLVACTGEGELLHANRAGRRELAHGGALWLAGGRVVCEVSLRFEFEHAVHEAVSARRTRMLLVGPEDDPLRVVVMPVDTESSDAPCALVMLGRRALCSPLGLQMMALENGLTPAEQRVLRALIDGRSAHEIALDHGVALSTVGGQIQAIRDKIGVRSVDALLLRAAQLPPVSSWQELPPAPACATPSGASGEGPDGSGDVPCVLRLRALG